MEISGLINKLRYRLPLFRPTIAGLSFIEDNSIETACTNGSEVLYSATFFGELSEGERLFVLAHELSHVALNHLNRRKDKDPFLWNIATDAVINAFLKRDGLTPPEGLVFIDDALSYSADELYRMLKSNEIPLPEGFSEAIEITNESHSHWDEGDSDKARGNSKGGLNDKGSSANEASGDIEENASESYDERSIFDKNKELKDQLERKLRDELSRGVNSFFSEADIGASPVREVSTIGKAKSLIEWRNILKEGARLELDYSFKNAQIEDGVLVSRLEEVPTNVTEILVDTSGSIDEPLLRAFLRECKGVLQSSRLRIAFFDHRVYPFHEIRTEADIDKLKIQGGGGTNYTNASKAFSPDCDNKIVFTDGEGMISNPPQDIIWVVFGRYSYLPKEARVIRVSEDKLRRSMRNAC